MKAESIATIGVCLSYVDGDIDPGEIACLMLAMDDLGISESAAEAAIDAATAQVQSAKNVDELLATTVATIPAKQRPALFELCAHVLMGDGQFSEAESQRLAAMRGLLGVDESVALRIVVAAAADAAGQEHGLAVV